MAWRPLSGVIKGLTMGSVGRSLGACRLRERRLNGKKGNRPNCIRRVARADIRLAVDVMGRNGSGNRGKNEVATGRQF